MSLKDVEFWGAATSAHQIEGGNHNQWSVWELENASELAKEAPRRYGWLKNWPEVINMATDPNNYVSGAATDHFKMYKDDFEIAKKLNLNAFRFSIEWSRIEPQEGEWDDSAIKHYKEYMKQLKARNLEPFVTLLHFTLPTWFAHRGGFAKRSNVKYFVRFAKRVVKELGDDVRYITTINEPGVYTYMSYLKGCWPPQHRSWSKGALVMLNLVWAHRRVYKELKRLNQDFKIGISKNYSYIYTEHETIDEKIAAHLSDYFGNKWILYRIKRYQDFVGINFYFSNRFVGTKPHNPDKKTNDLGWDMKPQNLYHVLKNVHTAFGKPIVVTESGVADANDKNRKWWIEQSLGAMEKACEEGARVVGYLHWSLLDNFEWADGFWPRFGLVEVDYQTKKRTIRKSALWYAEFIKTIKNRIS